MGNIEVAAGAQGGDSGAPVFFTGNDGQNYIYGLVWGGGGSTYVLSPWNSITGELGMMTTQP